MSFNPHLPERLGTDIPSMQILSSLFFISFHLLLDLFKYHQTVTSNTASKVEGNNACKVDYECGIVIFKKKEIF